MMKIIKNSEVEKDIHVVWLEGEGSLLFPVKTISKNKRAIVVEFKNSPGAEFKKQQKFTFRQNGSFVLAGRHGYAGSFLVEG